MASAQRGRPSRDSTASAPAGQSILEHIADTDRVEVLRFNAPTSTWNYAGSYDPAVVRVSGLAEFLRQRGGGGKYRARVRRNDGTYGVSAVITVEGAARPWADPEPVSSSTPASSSPIGAGSALEKFLGPFAVAAGTALGAAVVKWATESRKTDPLVLELLKRGGGVDPLELQNAIAAAEARGEARGRELGKLTAENAAPAAGEGALGAIERGLPQVLKTFNRALDIQERKVTVRQLPAPAIEPAPQNDHSHTGTSSTPAPLARDPLESLLLSVPLEAREFLLGAAERDEPAELYASLTYGRLDDVTKARLPELLKRSDFADVLARTWPAFADYAPWCETFVDALREAVAADVDEDDDESTSSEPKAAP